MNEIRIINYIDINGEEILFNSLPDDEKRKVAEIIQERIMAIAGYKRVNK